MKLKTAILLVLLLSVLPSQNVATFAKCARPHSVKAEYENATMVFLGKVVSEEERKLPAPVGPLKYDTAQVYRFQIVRWWKGGAKESVEIHVVKDIKFPDGRYDFGPEQIRFQKGESYLVYSSADNGLNFASGCTRTRLARYAQEDLQKLGRGQLPKTTP